MNALRWASLVGLLTVSLGLGLHVRGLAVARDAAARERDTWELARKSWSADDDIARRTGDTRRVSGAVVDGADQPVADADVVVVDLHRLQQHGDVVDLLAGVPLAAVEASARTGPDGQFECRLQSLGPKALFAAAGSEYSTSRWVCKLVDGVAARAFDLRVLPPARLGVRVTDGVPPESVRCAIVFEGLHIGPSPEVAAVGGVFWLDVPAGLRAETVVVTDIDTGTRKILPLRYGDGGRAEIALGLRRFRVPLDDGESASVRECVVDDMDFDIPDLCTPRFDREPGGVSVPVFGGTVAVTVRLSTGVLRAVASPGSDGPGAIAFRRAGAPEERFPVSVGHVLGGEPVIEACALLSERYALGDAEEDRMSLIRAGRRPLLPITDGVVSITAELAARFPVLQVTGESGRVARARISNADSVARIDVVPRTGEFGCVIVNAPWPYSWIRLRSDSGESFAKRAPDSGRVVFPEVPKRVPFVVDCDEGPYGWNRYAMAGGCIQGGDEARVDVQRPTERPRLSSRAELFGFVTGPTTARKVAVFCQPAGNPRGVSRVECKESPFYGFVLPPGDAYVLVAWPGDDVPDPAVQYMKTIVYQPWLREGERRRVDLALEPGVLRFTGGRHLNGSDLLLVAVDRNEDGRELRRVTWSWRHVSGLELRNVPAGRFRVERSQVADPASRSVSAEFVVDGAETRQVELLDR